MCSHAYLFGCQRRGFASAALPAYPDDKCLSDRSHLLRSVELDRSRPNGRAAGTPGTAADAELWCCISSDDKNLPGKSVESGLLGARQPVYHCAKAADAVSAQMKWFITR